MVLRTSGSSALADVDHQTRPNTFGDGKKDSKAANSAAAKDQLRNNEDLASGPASTVAASDNVNQNEIDESRAAENEPDFVNSVAGRDEEDKGKGSFAKRRAPLLIILGMIFGGGGLMFGMQSLMPFSLLEQLRTKFDTITAVTEKRSNVFLKYQLDNKDINNPIARKIFGTTFKVSNKQKAKLASQGIDIVDIDVDGKTKSVMLFDDGTGSRKIITSDSGTAQKVKNSFGNGISDLDIGGTKYKIDFGETVDFSTKFDSSPDFRNGYIKSSRTWRGAIGAWFDSITVRFLQSNNLTRNRFRNFQERVKSEANGNTKQFAMDLVNKTNAELAVAVENGSKLKDANGDEVIVEVETKTDANGKTENVYRYFKTVSVDGDLDKVEITDPLEISKFKVESTSMSSGSFKVKNAAEAHAKMESLRGTIGAKATGVSSAVVNGVCVIADFIGVVHSVIAAQEILNMVQIASSVAESVNKAQTEYSADSAINDYVGPALTQNVNTTVTYATDPTMKDTQDDFYEVDEQVVRSNSAMQASAIASLYTGKPVDINDPSVQNLTIGSSINKIISEVAEGVTSFMACSIARVAAAVAGAAVDLGMIAACALSFGIACVIDMVKDAAVSVGFSIAVAEGVTFASKMLLPNFVRTFGREKLTDIVGEDFGNALVAGTNLYMGNNHRSGGGTPATLEAYASYKNEKIKSDAEYARYQRETLSPFDISSQYTFLGSLAKQVITFGTATNAPTNIISTMSSMVSNSVASLLPSANAIDVSTDIIPNYDQICPTLASIGAVGDAFCNPYIVSDFSTIEDDPEELIVSISDQLTNDGEIKDDSDLAKFVLYCGERQSIFGNADRNIANNFSVGDANTGSDAIDTGINAIVGAIPVIGDTIDVLANSNQLKNIGWITGEVCVAGNSLYGTEGVDNAVSWGTMKKYQRYVEDQRLLESIDDNYTSTVTAFLDKYYAQNPLDTSYEAILARTAGVTKDDVIAVFDVMNYEEYLANYHPEERRVFGEEFDERTQIAPDNDFEPYDLAIIPNNILYFDLRNRIVNMA